MGRWRERPATRAPNRLPQPLTLAGLRWPRRSLAHVGQPREHGTQAVKQHKEGQNLGLGRKAQYQHALQAGRGLAGFAPRAAKAAQSVGTLAAGSFRDAEVGAQKCAAKLVLKGGIATGKTAGESVSKPQGDDGRVRPTCGAWAEPHQAGSGRCRKEGDCACGMSETRGLRSPYGRNRGVGRAGSMGWPEYRDLLPEFPDKR